MELPSELFGEYFGTLFNTRSKNEEHMLIVMDKSTHERKLSQLLKTNNKQLKNAVTFLTGYKGIFNVTNKNNKFLFISVFNGA